MGQSHGLTPLVVKPPYQPVLLSLLKRPLLLPGLCGPVGKAGSEGLSGYALPRPRVAWPQGLPLVLQLVPRKGAGGLLMVGLPALGPDSNMSGF